MKAIFHGTETFEENPEFAFKKIPDGVYRVRTTIYPDDGEPFDEQWPAELRDGTLYVLSKLECERVDLDKNPSGMDYTGLYEDLLAMESRAKEHAAKMESLKIFGRAAAFSAFAVECLDFRRYIIFRTRNLYW